MRTFVIALTTLFACANSWSQTAVPPSKISPSPTVQELTNAFVAIGQGQLDPFVVFPEIIARGDAAVPALTEVLFSDSVRVVLSTTQSTTIDSGAASTTVSDTLYPNKLLPAMALEGIGSQDAYAVLYQAALTHADPNVRGVALNALAGSYYLASNQKNFKPDKELIHLFLKSVDDTAMVSQFEKSVGQIAREGLINWTTQDVGEPQGKATKVRVGPDQTAMALSDFREQWWQQNSGKVSWDAKKGLFKLP